MSSFKTATYEEMQMEFRVNISRAFMEAEIAGQVLDQKIDERCAEFWEEQARKLDAQFKEDIQ